MLRPDYEAKKRKCLYCGELFKPAKPRVKFCCKEHYLKWVHEGRAYTNPEESEWRSLTPSQRWAKMSREDLSIECLRYHITYGQSQVMSYRNSLPEDFGLGEKVIAKFRKE